MYFQQLIERIKMLNDYIDDKIEDITCGGLFSAISLEQLKCFILKKLGKDFWPHQYDKNLACKIVEELSERYKFIGKIQEARKITQQLLEEGYSCGLIKKKDLETGKKYKGYCRNASIAVWNGSKFVYERYKFGDILKEEINHPEDDDRYDIFLPFKIIE